MVERTKVTSPPFRVSFPEVFESKSYDGSEPKYSLVMLFYPEKFTKKEAAQFQAMKALRDEACQTKFSKSFKDMKVNPAFKVGLRKGEEKPDLDGYGEGMVFATASSKMQPGLIDRDRTPIMKIEDFYPGCWARATLTAYGYDNKSKGVAFGLQNIQKLGEGESFSGRVDADEDFDNDEDDVWKGEETAPDLDKDDPLA